MRTLYQDEHCGLEVDDVALVATLTRSSTPFAPRFSRDRLDLVLEELPPPTK